MTVGTTPLHEPRMLIDGKLVDSQAGTFDVINPATEQVIGEVADGSASDMQQAIGAAVGSRTVASAARTGRRLRQYLEVRSVAWPAG
jgi:acyl-CoA reductase-like NAD-dependent aldehyde dehydrogenase